jgi:protein SCO1/2
VLSGEPMTLRADERLAPGAPRKAEAGPRGRRPLWMRVLPIAFALAIGLSLAVVLALRTPWFRRAESLPVLIQIDPFSLIDQHGNKVELADLRGQVWVADFMFTGCQSACPMLTARMRSLQGYLEDRQRALGHALPVRLVSFSVDPEVDTPARLAEYASRFGADDHRWLFLTGSLAEMNRAVTGSMKIPFQKGGADTSAFDVMHGEHIVVVDGKGRIRGYFDADPEGMTRIENAIETLVSEDAR